ncbi:MAG: glycine cleavage system protein H [Deltaproteobacteria bacterium]|nr:glycine cleavage system protein H [Deltaproteobacteria bacterium]
MDIFLTKGIEYLLVIDFLLILILFWMALTTPTPTRAAYRFATERLIPAIAEWFHLPEERYYHQGHSWAMPQGHGIVKIGVDDFAQKLVGRPTTVNLPPIGSRIEQGEVGWSLGFDAKTIDMISPVNGEVVAINKDVLRDPSVITQDPYEKGWLVMVKADKIKADLKNLLTGKLARAWMGETVDALRGRVAGDLGVVYQEEGLPVSGIAKNLSPDEWDRLAKEFLLTA